VPLRPDDTGEDTLSLSPGPTMSSSSEGPTLSSSSEGPTLSSSSSEPEPEAAGETWDPDATAGPLVRRAERLVGRYALGEVLGRGASGQVHRARDTLTGEDVAIKFVSPASPGVRHQLRRELTALRLLDLPGVVQLRDDGEDDGQTFLVMDLLPGGPVDRLAGPFERWAPAARTLLETLARVHFAGVVHRDLKPANILLDAGGRPVITDFGLAQGDAVERSGGRREGTPRYVAPEQWAGQPCDARSDLYAVGVILWELLHAARYDRDPTLAVGGPHAPVRVDAPPAVAAVIGEMLCADPARRPASAVDVLRAFGDDDPLLAGLPHLPDLVDEPTLRTLFDEPEHSFLHVAEDGAALLWAQTGGARAGVRASVERWLRTGRAHLTAGRIRIDRDGLSALGWEASDEAGRLIALRDRPAAELAAAALEAAQRARRSGDPGRAFTILDSVLPALDGEPNAAEVRSALAVEALESYRVPSLRRALYRAERAGDVPLTKLLRAHRLLASGEMGRALQLLGAASGLSGDAERRRQGLVAHALAHTDPEAARAWLGQIRVGVVDSPRAEAQWHGWAGATAYATGDYGAALDHHVRAAELLAEHPPERVVALTQAASAALEVARPDRASELASTARALATTLRLPHLEGRAMWLVRAAGYRGGADPAPMPGLVDAGAASSPLLEAQLALTEAAIAWRRGLTGAAGLACRSARAFAAAGHADAELLAWGLAAAAGAEIDRAHARTLLGSARKPSLALQAATLLGEAPDPTWRAAWHLPDPAARADVLSLAECEGQKGASQPFCST
jgi:hypothetical protein